MLSFFANTHFSTFKGAQGFRFFFPLPHSKILGYVVAAGAATYKQLLKTFSGNYFYNSFFQNPYWHKVG